MNISEQSLVGVRVLITRALGGGETESTGAPDPLAQLLSARGAQLIHIPVLEIREADDCADLDDCLAHLSEYDWTIFASQNAVRYTLGRANHLNISPAEWQRTKIAAVGPATAERLLSSGLKVQFSPSTFVADALVREFPGYPDGLKGEKIFWPRTNIGRTIISDGLKAVGAQVDTAVAYITGLPQDAEALAQDLVKKLLAEEIDIITLASAQSAKNLLTLLQIGLKDRKIAPATALARVKIAAIGPVTAESAQQCLGRVDISAREYTVNGLTEALLASLK